MLFLLHCIINASLCSSVESLWSREMHEEDVHSSSVPQGSKGEQGEIGLPGQRGLPGLQGPAVRTVGSSNAFP